MSESGVGFHWWRDGDDGFRSPDGWMLVRRTLRVGQYRWDVRDPSGEVRAYECLTANEAQTVADQLRMITESHGRGGMTGYLFCEAGPEDDCTDECMTRGLSASDALLLAQSRESRIAVLMAEAKALREYAAMRPV